MGNVFDTECSHLMGTQIKRNKKPDYYYFLFIRRQELETLQKHTAREREREKDRQTEEEIEKGKTDAASSYSPLSQDKETTTSKGEGKTDISCKRDQSRSHVVL